MRDLTETTLSSSQVYAGHVFRVETDLVRLPDGSSAPREVVRHPGGVGVLAVDDRGRVLLVRQFRYAAGRVVLEIPAGKLEAGESPDLCGRRELIEETGFRCGAFSSMGEILPTPGYCTERIHLFLAQELTAGEASPDEGEYVEPVWVSFADAERMVASGEISDGKTVAALYRYRLMSGAGG